VIDTTNAGDHLANTDRTFHILRILIFPRGLGSQEIHQSGLTWEIQGAVAKKRPILEAEVQSNKISLALAVLPHRWICVPDRALHAHVFRDPGWHRSGIGAAV